MAKYGREVIDRVRVDEANRLRHNRKARQVVKGARWLLLRNRGYRHVTYARRFWEGWYQRAIRSRIEPLKAFARNLKCHIDGVLAHCTYPLHTSLIEGINNKIKVIKRMAYGFRDDDYFFLKIRAAFPGIG